MGLRPRTYLTVGGLLLVYYYRFRLLTFLKAFHPTSTQVLIASCVLVGLIALRLLWFRRHAFIRRYKKLRPNLPTIHSADLTPDEFEEATAQIFAWKYSKHAEVMGGAGDGGIDVKLMDGYNRLWGIIQCKRYQPDKSLSPMYLRDLDSVKRRFKVDNVWLVTTASFSSAVRHDAKSWGILLVDGTEFERLRADFMIAKSGNKSICAFWKTKKPAG